MPYIPLIEQTTIVFSYLPFPDDIILDKKHALTALFQKKPLEYGYDGFMYGFAANEKLMKHYVDKLNAEEIGILHPYQFAIDEENAKQIMEVYDYVWTDEEI